MNEGTTNETLLDSVPVTLTAPAQQNGPPNIPVATQTVPQPVKKNAMSGNYRPSKPRQATGGYMLMEFNAPPVSFRLEAARKPESGELIVTQFTEHGKKAAHLDRVTEIYRGTDVEAFYKVLEERYGISRQDASVLIPS